MDIKNRNPQVTAVVVTYQSAAALSATLPATHRCYQAGLMDCIFVDNDSHDTTAQLLGQEARWADVVLTGVNNGFGRGCNIGLAKVATPYTLFLNPDAQIEPDAVAHMVAFLDAHPGVGIVGPATLCGDAQATRYQGTGPLPTPWSVVRRVMPLLPFKSDLAPILPGAAPFKTQWVCGAIILMRTDLARRLKGFDPRFFLYWEEMDLCRRAGAMGFETWAIGTAQAQHICGASSTVDDTQIFGCIGKHFYESRYYYMTKHHGRLAATVADAVEFALLAARTLLDVCLGKGSARLRPRLQTTLFSQPKPLSDAEKHIYQVTPL